MFLKIKFVTLYARGIMNGSCFYQFVQYIGASAFEVENVYQTGNRGQISGTISIASMMIRGQSALEQMPELDYKNIWQTVEGGTPVLRCFANAEKFSLTELPEKVEISFASNGGSSCDTITGYPLYTELLVEDLPIPTRYGYEFGGWYHFSGAFDAVEDGLFPNYNTVFFAKWIPVSFTVDFENNLDEQYDYNAGVEHLKPGMVGYDPIYVHGGLKSIHMSPTDNVIPIFLLSYENTLEIGKEYDIVLRINTDDDIPKKKIKLIHANHPQFDSDMVGYEEIEITDLKNGKWLEKKITIVANSPYLLISAEEGTSLYFDNIQVVPTGKGGKLGNIITVGASNADLQNRLNIITIVSVICGTVLLLASGIVISIVIIKKRRNK